MGVANYLRQRQSPQKRKSRLLRQTDQDLPILRQLVIIAGEIGLRFRECEVIVVGTAQIIRACVIRQPTLEIERVGGQAFPAGVLADGLVDRLVFLLGHREDVLRANQAGEAEACC